ncbi:MAG TPA: VWA domain-containing protein [Peptococcaceae bacterium]|nr:VWA domain-containing protein [Peptococcaceae bacterium]
MNEKVKLNLFLSHKYLKPDILQKVYLMLQIVQPKVKLEQSRMPLNLSFVLDRSGSMSGDKLSFTKKAVVFALNHLDSEDTVSIVTFDDEVNTLVSPQKAVHKDQMALMVKSIRPGGSTNLSGGLFKGAGLVRDNYRKEQVKRVLLLTDGLANVGVTEPEKIVAKVKGLAENNVSVSTLGVGDDFQEDLLVDIAEAGKGSFYYIASPDNLPEIFRQELQGLLSITGQNLELGIRPAQGVEVLRILGYEPQWGDEVKISLPDIYSGETKTVLVELGVKGGSIGKQNLGTVRFKYDDVLDGLASVDFEINMNIEVSDEESLLESTLDLKVIQEVEIFETAQIKEEAISRADSGDFQGARDLLESQKEKLNGIYSLTKDPEVLKEISELELNYQLMAKESYTSNLRKSMKQSNYNTRRKR